MLLIIRLIRKFPAHPSLTMLTKLKPRKTPYRSFSYMFIHYAYLTLGPLKYGGGARFGSLPHLLALRMGGGLGIDSAHAGGLRGRTLRPGRGRGIFFTRLLCLNLLTQHIKIESRIKPPMPHDRAITRVLLLWIQLDISPPTVEP